MNDPHVEALEYSIQYDPDIINWSGAEPMHVREEDFAVRAENGRVRFEFSAHHASEQEARSAVEKSYIPIWELNVGLTRGPNAFTLRFERSEIVDRDPPPGPLRPRVSLRSGYPTISAKAGPPRPPAYPEPPRDGLKRTPGVEAMFQRYLRHRRGAETLPATAYFCLTELDRMAGGRDKVAAHFSISRNVLDRIGRLSAEKGGTVARKAKGRNAPYSPDEERFLTSAIETLIRRVAQVEYGPDPTREKITLNDI